MIIAAIFARCHAIATDAAVIDTHCQIIVDFFMPLAIRQPFISATPLFHVYFRRIIVFH